MANEICVIGNVATEPVLTKASGRVAYCTFRLANNEGYFDREKNTWVEADTNWFQVKIFRSLAENAQASFKKGDRVMVYGRLKISQWKSNDQPRETVEIEASSIGHDLRWGVSSFTKNQGLSAAAADPAASTPQSDQAQAQAPETSTASEGAPASSDLPSSAPKPKPPATTPVSEDGFLPAMAG